VEWCHDLCSGVCVCVCVHVLCMHRSRSMKQMELKRGRASVFVMRAERVLVYVCM
jgi:hypothetical protein